MAAIDSDRLRTAMDRAPMTTKQLADAVGVSLTYMSDITHGRRSLKRNPGLRRQIAVALGCPTDWIEHHTPQPEPVG